MPKTQSQPLSAVARQTLVALFELTAENQPVDAGSVARAIGAKTASVGEALCELDALGLIWLSRCALTMAGLARAARLQRQRQSARRHAA
jgi:Mn-dependent DtxR family transcriptional regulator